MMSLDAYRAQWVGNIPGDLMAGLVVALALIPEAIAFSIIAGVDPRVGLYASVSIAVLIAFVGGRPGMISAATAATAVLMVTILVLTALTMTFGWDVRTVGDMGAPPDTLPVFLIPGIPLTLATLLIILPYSLAIAVEDFMNAFDFKEALDKGIIDVSRAHIWDISSVQALDMVVLKFRRDGAEVEIVGMNAATETIVDRLAVHDRPGAVDRLLAH